MICCFSHWKNNSSTHWTWVVRIYPKWHSETSKAESQETLQPLSRSPGTPSLKTFPLRLKPLCREKPWHKEKPYMEAQVGSHTWAPRQQPASTVSLVSDTSGGQLHQVTIALTNIWLQLWKRPQAPTIPPSSFQIADPQNMSNIKSWF